MAIMYMYSGNIMYTYSDLAFICLFLSKYFKADASMMALRSTNLLLILILIHLCTNEGVLLWIPYMKYRMGKLHNSYIPHHV